MLCDSFAIVIGYAAPRQVGERRHVDDVTVLSEKLPDLDEVARIRVVATNKLSCHREGLLRVHCLARPIKVVLAVFVRLELATIPISLARVSMLTLIAAFG